MAASNRSRVVDAIAFLGDNRMVVTADDYSKFEALIGDYFDDTECNSDDSRSEADMECGKYFP